MFFLKGGSLRSHDKLTHWKFPAAGRYNDRSLELRIITSPRSSSITNLDESAYLDEVLDDHGEIL